MTTPEVKRSESYAAIGKNVLIDHLQMDSDRKKEFLDFAAKMHFYYEGRKDGVLVQDEVKTHVGSIGFRGGLPEGYHVRGIISTIFNNEVFRQKIEGRHRNGITSPENMEAILNVIMMRRIIMWDEQRIRSRMNYIIQRTFVALRENKGRTKILGEMIDFEAEQREKSLHKSGTSEYEKKRNGLINEADKLSGYTDDLLIRIANKINEGFAINRISRNENLDREKTDYIPSNLAKAAVFISGVKQGNISISNDRYCYIDIYNGLLTAIATINAFNEKKQQEGSADRLNFHTLWLRLKIKELKANMGI